jgi:hypothetical protein
VADLVSLQNFKNWIDMSLKHYWCGDIRSSLLSYLDSCHIFSQEDKLECLHKLIMELEIEQEAQWICQDSSHFEEFSDQEQEQYELKTYEALLTRSEQYKEGMRLPWFTITSIMVSHPRLVVHISSHQ